MLIKTPIEDSQIDDINREIKETGFFAKRIDNEPWVIVVSPGSGSGNAIRITREIDFFTGRPNWNLRKIPILGFSDRLVVFNPSFITLLKVEKWEGMVMFLKSIIADIELHAAYP